MRRTVTRPRSERILIVNPDLAVATVYAEKFERENFLVEVVGNSKLALRIIELEPVDLAVLDLSRSETATAQFLAALRSQPAARTLPVVVVLNPHFITSEQGAAGAERTRWASKCDSTPAHLLALVREALAPGIPNARKTQAAAAFANGSEPEPDEHVLGIFFAAAPYTIARLRTAHRMFLNSWQRAAQLAEIFDMHRQAGLLAGVAGLAGFRTIALLACALEFLLVQLHAEGNEVTKSVHQTVREAIELLAFSVEGPSNPSRRRRTRSGRRLFIAQPSPQIYP